MAIAICAVISGADGWNDVECFGRAKQKWLQKFLKLTNGIPSHDTFRRVFSILPSENLEIGFCNWIKTAYPRTGDDVIAIDGKTLRRSLANGVTATHIVSAWSTKHNAVLAQERVADKAGELTAIPILLKRLCIQGDTITIDALGCQTEIASTILKSGANYVLSLKANQPATYLAVKTYFEKKLKDKAGIVGRSFYDSFDSKRRVRRVVWVIRGLSFLENRDKWPGLKSIVAVESCRVNKNSVSKEIRFFISSLNASAKEFGQIIRSHWGIENHLHWSLDVSFREDDSRLRYKNSAQNFSVLRRIALNLIRQHHVSRGIMSRRRRAGWDESFLEGILNKMSPCSTTVERSFVFADLFLSPASYKEWSESIR